MANIIKIKRKTTTGPPLIGDLVDGEMCLVVPDLVIYQRVDASNLIKISSVLPITIAISDLTSDLAVGTNKGYFRAPFAGNIVDVTASVIEAPTGSNVIIDININGVTTMATNKLSIDATEKTSTTATTPAALTNTAIAFDDEITFDIDQIGSTLTGKGVEITVYLKPS